MYLLQVYSYVSPAVWFAGAVFFIGLVYVLEYYRRRAVSREKSSGDGFNADASTYSSRSVVGNYTSLVECSSPNCVRCNKSRVIVQRARQRLSFYCVPLGNQEIENDVLNLNKDLKNSESLVSGKSDPVHLQETNNGSCLNAITTITSTPRVFFMRGLRENEFFQPEEFPGLANVITKYDQIRLEFLHLYQSPLPETKSLWKTNKTGSGKWELAHLVDQGKLTKAGELCPLTMSILNHLPSFMKDNLFGNAAFSIVHPQTEIMTHCGPTNIRIRCHLGLQVPLESYKLRVSDTDIEWKEREVLCFNDAFPHSVHHYGEVSSGMRVVLMLDLWHPDLSLAQQKLLDYVFSPTG